MARSLHRTVGWDHDTGKKTRASRLMFDVERGIFTEDPDRPNPQRWLRPPGPDGVGRPLVPPLDEIRNVTIDIGFAQPVGGRYAGTGLAFAGDLSTRYLVPGTDPEELLDDEGEVLATPVALEIEIGGFA